MEPIPEVQSVAGELEQALSSDGLLANLSEIGRTATRIVPSCVGVSITLVVDGEPFTVTATSEVVRELDAAQYLEEDGPCLASASGEEVVQVTDVLDEQRWRLFAEAGAARGIRSSLSLPLRQADWTVCGALNLYASEPHAFDAPERLIQEVFGQLVPGAVANADLSFRTRDHARELPQQLADRAKVDQAVGVLVGRNGWAPQAARERIHRAAGNAGISPAEAAELLISLAT